jgi:hypothetical protein
MCWSRDVSPVSKRVIARSRYIQYTGQICTATSVQDQCRDRKRSGRLGLALHLVLSSGVLPSSLALSLSFLVLVVLQHTIALRFQTWFLPDMLELWFSLVTCTLTLNKYTYCSLRGVIHVLYVPRTPQIHTLPAPVAAVATCRKFRHPTVPCNSRHRNSPQNTPPATLRRRWQSAVVPTNMMVTSLDRDDLSHCRHGQRRSLVSFHLLANLDAGLPTTSYPGYRSEARYHCGSVRLPTESQEYAPPYRSDMI